MSRLSLCSLTSEDVMHLLQFCDCYNNQVQLILTQTPITGEDLFYVNHENDVKQVFGSSLFTIQLRKLFGKIKRWQEDGVPMEWLRRKVTEPSSLALASASASTASSSAKVNNDARWTAGKLYHCQFHDVEVEIEDSSFWTTLTSRFYRCQYLASNTIVYNHGNETYRFHLFRNVSDGAIVELMETDAGRLILLAFFPSKTGVLELGACSEYLTPEEESFPTFSTPHTDNWIRVDIIKDDDDTIV